MLENKKKTYLNPELTAICGMMSDICTGSVSNAEMNEENTDWN